MPLRYLPLKSGTFRWGSPYGMRAGGMHWGVDFEAPDGTPIYAAQAGTVAHIGAASGFGQWIVLDHPAADGGGTTVYGHMWDASAIGLKQGQWVAAGQLIAHVGSNGQSSGPHLHFEVHPTVWRAASQIDPRPWLDGALNPPRSNTGGTPMGWTGDPTWLEDVLRPDLGGRLKTLAGWRDAGHGDFKDIRGVMFHHTGNSREPAESIRKGRSDLPGPLSQLHIGPDGTVTVVAAGVAWHAGVGSYPWLPTNMGNWHMIGIECAWPRVNPNGSFNENDPWPRAQVISIRDTVAALLKKLGFGSDRVIGHKEYAGRAQGKWDPGNVDMPWFRGEVAKDMAGFVFPGEGTATTTPMPSPAPSPPVDAYAGVLLFKGVVGAADRVTKLEARLKRAYSTLVVDGVFDQRTEDVVKDYQTLHGLDPDGIVGPATATSLGLVL